MRAKGTTRGDGPPAGVRIPTPHGCDRFTKTRGNGPRLRRRHVRRNQSALPTAHEGYPNVVLSRSRRTRDSETCRDGIVPEIYPNRRN